MMRPVKLVTVLLSGLILIACGGTPVHAPIDSRDNSKSSSSSAGVTTSPAKSRRNYYASGAKYHIVKPGETLYSIARKHRMGYWQLAIINDIQRPFTIYKGQRIKLQGKQKANGAVVSTPKAVTKKSVKTASKSSSVIKFDGAWQWPTRGRLLRGYKPNKPGKKGLNIGGHSGQPVKAAASGKVVYVGSGLVGYGRLIIIRHNENLLSTYGHNSKLLVDEGEYVKTGQMIAKMGSSGTGRTELYFEIRKDGKPVNPLNYLPKQR